MDYNSFRLDLVNAAEAIGRIHIKRDLDIDAGKADIASVQSKLQSIKQTKSAIRQIICVQADSTAYPFDSTVFPFDEWSGKISKYIDAIDTANTKLRRTTAYDMLENNLQEIKSMLGLHIKRREAAKKYLSAIKQRIKVIEQHPNFFIWSTKAERLILTHPQSISDLNIFGNTEKGLDTIAGIVGIRLGLFTSEKDRNISMQLYSAYNWAKTTSCEEVERLLDKYEKFNPEYYIKLFLDYSDREYSRLTNQIANMQDAIRHTEQNTDADMSNEITREIGCLTEKYDPVEWNAHFKSFYIQERRISEALQSGALPNVLDSDQILIGWREYPLGRDISDPYAIGVLQQALQLYPNVLFPMSPGLVLRLPEFLPLDQSNWRFALTSTKEAAENRQAIEAWCRNLVFSVLLTLPAGKAEFHFCDPGNTGIFSVFRDIGKDMHNGSDSAVCHYLSTPDQIMDAFTGLSQDISYVINQILIGSNSTLYQHNRTNSYNMRAYHFLLLNDFPRGMNRSTLELLQNIIDNGPRCGIYTILLDTGSNRNLLSEQERVLSDTLLDQGFSLQSGTVRDTNNRIFSYAQLPANIQQISTLIAAYNAEMQQKKEINIPPSALAVASSNDGSFRIPIGLNQGGETEYLSFFGSCQNYLMSGATGSGKSNALHVIMHMALKHIPDLELYVLDFKQGVEFAPYAKLNHPALRILAIECIPEFGISVLRHIKQKIQEIAKLYHRSGAEDHISFFEKTGKRIPVTLLIIDEFQHLFDGSDAEECSEIIEYIATEGRAFNVHFILSTQSISVGTKLTEKAKRNIFGRMVFFHSQEEYSAMLWNDPGIAATLSKDARGTMVLATSPDNRRVVHFARRSEFADIQADIGRDLLQGRYATKLLLSTPQDNPFSIFNAFLADHYQPRQEIGLALGDQTTLAKSDVAARIQNSSGAGTTHQQYDECALTLTNGKSENVILLGGDSDSAVQMLYLSLYSLLLRQAAMKKFHSILVLLSDEDDALKEVCNAHTDLIQWYTQEDDLSHAFDMPDLEYVLICGLQNFRRSLRFQAMDLAAQSQDALSGRGNSSFGQLRKTPEGDALCRCLTSENVHVVAWVDRISSLEEMYGKANGAELFLSLFRHRLGMRMSTQDAEVFFGWNACADIQNDAVFYQKNNSEKVLRLFKIFDFDYASMIDQKIEQVLGTDRTQTSPVNSKSAIHNAVFDVSKPETDYVPW